MSDESKTLSEGVLSKLEVSRRGFVKNLTIGTAFVVPLMASYSMDSLRAPTAHAAGQSEAANITTRPGLRVREIVIRTLQSLGIPAGGRRD